MDYCHVNMMMLVLLMLCVLDIQAGVYELYVINEFKLPQAVWCSGGLYNLVRSRHKTYTLYVLLVISPHKFNLLSWLLINVTNKT